MQSSAGDHHWGSWGAWFGTTVGSTCWLAIAAAVLVVKGHPIDARLKRQGFLTVLGLRLVLFLAPPLNWLIGTTGVGYPQYVAGSALGLVPGVAITVCFADEITALQSWRELATPSVAVPALLVLGFFAVSVIVARRLAARDARRSGPGGRWRCFAPAPRGAGRWALPSRFPPAVGRGRPRSEQGR